MTHSKQAEKRVRQNKKRQLRNRSQKSRIKTYRKRFLQAIDDGDRSAAEKELEQVQTLLDRAAKTRLFHPNKVDRDKSRLAKKLNSID